MLLGMKVNLLLSLTFFFSLLFFFYMCLYNFASCLSKSLDMHCWFSRYGCYYRKASTLDRFDAFSPPLFEKCASTYGVYTVSEWMPFISDFNAWRRTDVLFIYLFIFLCKWIKLLFYTVLFMSAGLGSTCTWALFSQDYEVERFSLQNLTQYVYTSANLATPIWFFWLVIFSSDFLSVCLK